MIIEGGKMKYLKATMALFVATLCLGLVGVSARQYTQLINIKIPAFSGEFISKQVDKGDDWNLTQKVKKTSISDDWSGDGRAIEGRIQGMFHGMITTGWKNLPQGSNIDFGSGTEVQGGWKLWLKSTKTLPSTATGSFNWDLGTIDYSPYPIKG